VNISMLPHRTIRLVRTSNPQPDTANDANNGVPANERQSIRVVSLPDSSSSSNVNAPSFTKSKPAVKPPQSFHQLSSTPARSGQPFSQTPAIPIKPSQSFNRKPLQSFDQKPIQSFDQKPIHPFGQVPSTSKDDSEDEFLDPVASSPPHPFEPRNIDLNADVPLTVPIKSEKTSKNKKIDPETGLTADTMLRRKLCARYEELLAREGLRYRLDDVDSLTHMQLTGLLHRGQSHLEKIGMSEEVMSSIYEKRKRGKVSRQREEVIMKAHDSINDIIQQTIKQVWMRETEDEAFVGLENDPKVLFNGIPSVDASQNDLLVADRCLAILKQSLLKEQAEAQKELEQLSMDKSYEFFDPSEGQCARCRPIQEVLAEKVAQNEKRLEWDLENNTYKFTEPTSDTTTPKTISTKSKEQCARCRPIVILERPKIVNCKETELDSKLNLLEQLDYDSDLIDNKISKFIEQMALQFDSENDYPELSDNSFKKALKLKLSFSMPDEKK